MKRWYYYFMNLNSDRYHDVKYIIFYVYKQYSMEPETQTLPHKKTYLEAALTPVTTPNNSPDRNIFIIN